MSKKKINQIKSNAMLVYYKFECDDINRPPHVETDLTFELSEYDKVLKAMEELDSNGLKYTLVLERFDERTDLIVSRDYLKVNWWRVQYPKRREAS